ncbi:MAG: phosphatidate cytidylyltransferase [Saprospiraceae bacterium]|nr:phosphatidate cytidylyltransferase [Saprospiraceae bacterium]
MLKRSITGLVLGVLMIAALTQYEWTALLLLIMILLGSAYEWFKHFVSLHSPLIRLVYIIFTIIVLCLILLLYLKTIEVSILHMEFVTGMTLFLLALTALGAVYSKTVVPSTVSWHNWIFYILFPILICFHFLHQDFQIHKWILLGLVFINWSNDVFAYFTGKLIGKTPLAPQISPNKTIEGTIGGMIASILTAFLVNQFLFISAYPIFQIFASGLMRFSSRYYRRFIRIET